MSPHLQQNQVLGAQVLISSLPISISRGLHGLHMVTGVLVFVSKVFAGETIFAERARVSSAGSELCKAGVMLMD